jgi:hypothetical protein
MLPRCSSSWLRTRLPTSGPVNQIPVNRVTIHLRKACQTWNSACQLSSCLHRHPYLQHPQKLASRHSAKIMASHTHARSHSGHGGHHNHHHDNTYLVSSNKNDAGVRITRIGLFVNLAMAIGKGIGGYVFHSQGKYCFGYLVGNQS